VSEIPGAVTYPTVGACEAPLFAQATISCINKQVLVQRAYVHCKIQFSILTHVKKSNIFQSLPLFSLKKQSFPTNLIKACFLNLNASINYASLLPKHSSIRTVQSNVTFNKASKNG
jgi:hypothetical protein